ncbi:hypothetical protein [Ruthenibacterium lactatiformans]|uniref:hypothetical protein n=1 Tax=Ruthenibacterium lactatiformans TaxID=1550024 RepID=UPI00249534DA|nr:hypothetical protein [Ruthenibacterium lactatiformans]
MERLTKSLSNGNASWNYPIICFGEDDSKNKVFKSVHRQKACEKLSAYEETGLEPEDMKKAFNEDATLKLAGQALGMSPDRLRELAQAEKEGRLVVLPCKDWFEIVFGEQVLFWGIDTDYIETPIREISVDNAERFTWYDGWKTLVLRGNDENGLDWEFSPEDIGKTVFLTREAAEAALKDLEADNDR